MGDRREAIGKTMDGVDVMDGVDGMDTMEKGC